MAGEDAIVATLLLRSSSLPPHMPSHCAVMGVVLAPAICAGSTPAPGTAPALVDIVSEGTPQRYDLEATIP